MSFTNSIFNMPRKNSSPNYNSLSISLLSLIEIEEYNLND